MLKHHILKISIKHWNIVDLLLLSLGMAEDIQLDCPEADCDGKSQALPATYASAQTADLNLYFSLHISSDPGISDPRASNEDKTSLDQQR